MMKQIAEFQEDLAKLALAQKAHLKKHLDDSFVVLGLYLSRRDCPTSFLGKDFCRAHASAQQTSKKSASFATMVSGKDS